MKPLLALALLAFAAAHTEAQTPKLAGACWRPPVGAALWSDPATWPGGALPAAGECAVIGAGQTVYLDLSPPPLGALDVQGTLIFACKDLTLTADKLRVGGRLEIGASGRAFRHRAVIVLADSYDCDPGLSERTLLVEGSGVLAMHGRPRAPSWTQLASTANAGSATIELTEAVAWKPGDRIAIASTDFDPGQAEERTIVSVAGATVALDAPLAYEHWGAVEGLALDGIGVDERAEVALLSRDVVIQGTPVNDVSGRVLAGHVVLQNPLAGGPRAEIEWVEFRDLGDEGLIGRHPLHLNELGAAGSTYVRAASFHGSYNRAIVLHGVQGATIEDCVACGVVGHGFTMGDSDVRGTTWRRNLSFGTRAAQPQFAIWASDLHPASFWLDHPDNVIEDNVAAGSDAFGFWFDPQDGESTPPASFRGNVAHSNGDSGFFQDVRPHPATLALYADLVAYKNRRFGAWIRSYGPVELRNVRLADNRGGFYFASEGFQNDFVSPSGISTLVLRDSLVIGESENRGLPLLPHELAAGRSLPQVAPNPPASFQPAWDTLVGVEIYDGLHGVEDVRFANFAELSIPGTIERRAAALSQVFHDSPWAVDPRNWVAGLAFTNAQRVWLRSPLGPHVSGAGLLGDNGIANSTLLDLDGSLTGSPGARVLADNPFLLPAAGAVFDPAWNAHVVTGTDARAYGQVELFNLSPLFGAQSAADLMRMTSMTRAQTFEIVSASSNPSPFARFRFATNVVTEDLYELEYDAATPRSSWSKIFALSFQFSEPGRWVVVSVPLPPISGGSVDLDGQPAQAVATLAELLAGPGNQFFWDADTLRVWFKIAAGDLGGGGDLLFQGARRTFFVFAQ